MKSQQETLEWNEVLKFDSQLGVEHNTVSTSESELINNWLVLRASRAADVACWRNTNRTNRVWPDRRSQLAGSLCSDNTDWRPNYRQIELQTDNTQTTDRQQTNYRQREVQTDNRRTTDRQQKTTDRQTNRPPCLIKTFISISSSEPEDQCW